MTPILLALPVVVWDFAISDQGLVPDGETDQWEHGVPTSGPGGPQSVWATRLAGHYLNDSTDHLELQLPDVSGLARPTLVVHHWYEFGPGDGGRLEVHASDGWHLVEPTYGYPSAQGFSGSSGWIDTTVPLDGHGPAPRVRLTFSSDAWHAHDGWYVARVELYDGDVTPPWVHPTVWPTDTQDLDGPYVVRAEVLDDVALQSVRLHWSTPSDAGEVAMVPLGGNLVEGAIPAQPPGTVVEWRVEAVDHAGNIGSAPDAPGSFRVHLAAPRSLVASWTGRAVGQAVELTWLPPISQHPVLGYVVQDVDGQVEPYLTSAPPMLLDLAPGDPQQWHVAALYAEGAGDWSQPLHLDVEQPSLTRLEPASALQGRTFHLRLEGASLYLLDEHSDLELGEGVEVLELDVLDVETLEAWVEVDPRATPGPRDVVVRGVQGEATFAGAFEVLDAASALHAVSVIPSVLRQGALADVRIEVSEPLGPELTVHADDALLVHGVPTVDDRTITLPLAVGASAAPGRYVIVLDDGASRVPVELDVEERQIGGVQRACRHAGSAEPVGVLVAALVLFRRRRDGWYRRVARG